MKFFTGVHQPKDAKHLPLACISINRLRGRKSKFEEPAEWILDSGAFTSISKDGEYSETPEEYARSIARWASPRLKGVVAQDYMCEPHILAKTGLTVLEHQLKTRERYVRFRDEWERIRQERQVPKEQWPVVIPVLQGWTREDYELHLALYGDLLEPGAWVGVGSVCKRQGRVAIIEEILGAIKRIRPDLRLHGFGVKLQALRSKIVQALLYSADSMAWSFSARKQKRDGNSIGEALWFAMKVWDSIRANG